jgi:hypothetical protein
LKEKGKRQKVEEGKKGVRINNLRLGEGKEEYRREGKMEKEGKKRKSLGGICYGLKPKK